MILLTENKSLRRIAKEIGRNVSSISREIKRSFESKSQYSAVNAQRKKSKRHKLLENTGLYCLVQRLFLEQQWSPEQISMRISHENSQRKISYNTIYRAIYAGMFGY